MKAIILAAGRGSRMGEHTDDKPKCLTLLNNKPLIEYQINALRKAGIEEIGIVTGFKSEELEKYGDKHFHNSIWSNTNMYYSLLCAKEWLENGDAIISYADIFYGAEIIKNMMLSTYDIAISYDPNWEDLWKKRYDNPLDDAETFKMNNNSELVEIGNKAGSISEIQGQYMGLLKISSNFWNINYEGDIKQCDMTKFLNYCLQKNRAVHCLPNQEEWGEVDTYSDLLLYRER